MDWAIIISVLGVLATAVAPVLTTILEANRRDKWWSSVMECARILDDPNTSSAARSLASDRLAEMGLTADDLKNKPMERARANAEALFAPPPPVQDEDPETRLIRSFFRKWAQISDEYDEANRNAYIRRMRIMIYVYVFGCICAALSGFAIARALTN